MRLQLLWWSLNMLLLVFSLRTIATIGTIVPAIIVSKVWLTHKIATWIHCATKTIRCMTLIACEHILHFICFSRILCRFRGFSSANIRFYCIRSICNIFNGMVSNTLATILPNILTRCLNTLILIQIWALELIRFHRHILWQRLMLN